MIIRQGDIYFKKVDENELNNENYETRQDNVIVGHGESHGHKHVVSNAEWLVAAAEDIEQFAKTGVSKSDVYIKVEEEGLVTHEEHSPLVLTNGVWKVWRQREYDPDNDERFVLD